MIEKIKVKYEISQCHKSHLVSDTFKLLALKAEEFTTLEQAAELSHRIEFSFQTQTRGDIVLQSEKLNACKSSNALFTSSGKSNSRSPQQRSKKCHC